MDWILLAFFICIFSACRFIPNGVDSKETYLSLDNTKVLRGFLAIAIVLHHISEHSNDGRFFSAMVHAGYLIVAVFFFLSGYGLLISYIKKGRNYLKGFWKNRILYLFIIWFLVSLGYLLYDVYIGRMNIGVKSFLFSFINGHPIAINSWYIIVQLIMYICFWVAYIIPSNTLTNERRIAILFSLLVLIAILFNRIGYSSIWYISNFAFVFGLLYAEKKPLFDIMLSNRWWVCLFITTIVFIAFSAAPLLLEHFDVGIYTYRLISRMVSSVAFVSMLIVLLFRIRVTGNLWRKIGLMSLEIYLLHGMVYSFFHSEACYIKQDWLWTLLTLALTIIIAIPAHYVSTIVAKLLQKK